MGSTKSHKLQSDYVGLKTKDEFGNIVKGIYRTITGGLVVSDTESYNKYIKEKKAAEDFLAVKRELEELRETVKILLQQKENGLK